MAYAIQSWRELLVVVKARYEQSLRDGGKHPLMRDRGEAITTTESSKLQHYELNLWER